MGGGTDGCIPQTREHITITKQLGPKHLVVSTTMCDDADVEMIETRELLEEMGFKQTNKQWGQAEGGDETSSREETWLTKFQVSSREETWLTKFRDEERAECFKKLECRIKSAESAECFNRLECRVLSNILRNDWDGRLPFAQSFY